MKKVRTPLTLEEQDRRAITIALFVLWLVMVAITTAEVCGVVRLVIWYEDVRGL